MANPNRLTAQQSVDLLKELTGDEIKPMTFHSYVARGHAPKPVEKIGNTPLWKRTEIEKWAENRPGRGARTDLRKTRRRPKDHRHRMNEWSGEHIAVVGTSVAAWVAISIALATMTASTGVGYFVLLLLLLAGALVWVAISKRRALIRWPSVTVATIFVVVAVYVGLINDPSDSDEPTAFSATTSERPTTTTTTPLTTTPASTVPTPAGPPLPMQEQVIDESRSAEFFDGALLLANRYTYSSYVSLTITTDAMSCTSGYLDVGERAVIAANDAGNRFFRVTVLETDPNTSARLRVEDLPQENWPARSPSCPV